LGSLVKVEKIVDEESLMTALKETLPERYHDMIPLNKKALEMGMNLVNGQ